MSEPGPRWFYIQNGRRCGPADLSGLVDLILRQELPEDALVWHAGLTEWVKASDVPEVRRELPPPIPPGVGGGAAPIATADPVEADEIAPLGETLAPPGAPIESLGGRGHRRHRSKAKVDESRRRRWLMVVVVVLLTLMVGLWLLLKRFNEVPAGVIIHEGSARPGPRSPAEQAVPSRPQWALTTERLLTFS